MLEMKSISAPIGHLVGTAYQLYAAESVGPVTLGSFRNIFVLKCKIIQQ